MKTLVVFEFKGKKEIHTWNRTPEDSIELMIREGGGWQIDSVENGVTTLVNPSAPDSYDFIRFSEA